MTDAEARAALERLIDERREDYAGLSRLIGRNPAYIQQYIRRGTPRRLAEEDRRTLAIYFGVDESLLGGLPGRLSDAVQVPRLDIGASAGAGAHVEERRASSHLAFDPAWLRRLSGGGIDTLALLRVEGDSMSPALNDGDDILVDGSPAALRPRDGVYVLRMDDVLLVKRVSPAPSGRLSVASDNQAYPTWPDCDPATLTLVGRVIWAGRRIG